MRVKQSRKYAFTFLSQNTCCVRAGGGEGGREGGRPSKPDPNTGSFFLSALPWSGRTNLIADCWTQLGNLLELRAGRALTLQTLQPHT